MASTGHSKHAMADRLTGLDRNVWVEFTTLQRETGAVNLGQGFPDFMPPKFIRDALVAAAASESRFAHQYTRGFGHPRLVNVLSETFSPLLGHKLDPLNEILVTVGGYGALFCCVQGLVNPGDEVIIIEPFFDCYQMMVQHAGGKSVFVPLRNRSGGEGESSAEWTLDMEELGSKFNSKTKALFINNPNNPFGKVFSKEELEGIASLCRKHDVLVFSDDVYEWLVYPPNTTCKIASLPGMWDRTITIGSAGKTFSVTGWKLGWALGPNHLIHALQVVQQNSVFTCPTPLQEAAAMGFELELSRQGHPDSYLQSLQAELMPKRDRLAALLRAVGMKPIVPQGGYFIMADFTGLAADFEDGTDDPRDYKFVRWLTKKKGIAAIPPTAFYSSEHKSLGDGMVRLCFAKEDATLDKAEEILKQWNDSQ